jgi:hypothetical protein
MVQTQSPSSLIRPSLEKIHHLASGRKYGKLRQNAQVRHRRRRCAALPRVCPPRRRQPRAHTPQALLESLDSLCVVAAPHEASGARPNGAAAAQPGSVPASPGGKGTAAQEDADVEVQLQLSAGGGVVLTLRPGKQSRRQAATEAAAPPAYAGQEPATPVVEQDTAGDRPGVLCDAGAKGGSAPAPPLCSLAPGAPARPPCAPRLPTRPRSCHPGCRAPVLPARRGGDPQATSAGAGAGLSPEAGRIQAAAGAGLQHQPQVGGAAPGCAAGRGCHVAHSCHHPAAPLTRLSACAGASPRSPTRTTWPPRQSLPCSPTRCAPAMAALPTVPCSARPRVS